MIIDMLFNSHFDYLLRFQQREASVEMPALFILIYECVCDIIV